MTGSIIIFFLIGYFSGSVLFSKVSEKVFGIPDVSIHTNDHNPGTANAFKNGGFAVGLFTLAGDLLKAFLPVFIYCRMYEQAANNIGISIVLAAPVLGHCFSFFYRFKGGKGIAATFGALLGLFPNLLPFFILAFVFIFFSLILVVNPTYYRTLYTYIAFAAGCIFFEDDPYIAFGAVIISSIVIVRLLISKEERKQPTVEAIWKR